MDSLAVPLPKSVCVPFVFTSPLGQRWLGKYAGQSSATFHCTNSNNHHGNSCCCCDGSCFHLPNTFLRIPYSPREEQETHENNHHRTFLPNETRQDSKSDRKKRNGNHEKNTKSSVTLSYEHVQALHQQVVQEVTFLQEIVVHEPHPWDPLEPSQDSILIHETYNPVLDTEPIGSNIDRIGGDFWDFTTIFSKRDSMVGFGLQIKEWKQCIFVHAILCIDGQKLDTLESYWKHTAASFVSSSSSSCSRSSSLNQPTIRHDSQHNYNDDYEENVHSSFHADYCCPFGPAGNAGIRPGDRILGIHGKSFAAWCYEQSCGDDTIPTSLFYASSDTRITPASRSLLLSYAASFLRQAHDPIILHIRRYKSNRFELQSSSQSILTNTDEDECSLSSVSFVGREDALRSHPKKTFAHVEPVPSVKHNHTNQDWLHPFVQLLAKKGIIRSSYDDKITVMKQLRQITERAYLLESIQGSNTMSSLHFPSTNRQQSSIVSLEDVNIQSSKRPVSPQMHGRHIYPASRFRTDQDVDGGCNDAAIMDGFTTMRKALCARILDTFIDGDRLAYTIWVYDVELKLEWYVVRYTGDFIDLREATSRLSKAIERVQFLNYGWFSSLTSNEVTESQVSRDARCHRLEAFVRELCSAIYKHPLTPNSAEVAVYIQSFLGCDSCLERMVCCAPHELFAVQSLSSRHEDESEELTKIRFKTAIQLYSYRLFHLSDLEHLVTRFISELLNSSSPINAVKGSSSYYKKRELQQSKLIKCLKRIKAFLHHIQELIIDGGAEDFLCIADRPEYLSMHKSRKVNISNQDNLVRDAVRIQVEIEIYVPLRSSLSKQLSYFWRKDDLEISRKIQILKELPQSFFSIPLKFHSVSSWTTVSDIISVGVGRQTLPCIKLQAIVDAANEIPRLFQIEHGEDSSLTLSADDILPIFIFAFVRADLDRPHALCVLLRNICDPTSEIGLLGYYLSTFEAAVTYVMQLSV